jgi:ATP synthase protein I
MSQGDKRPDGARPASTDQQGLPPKPPSLSDLGARLDAVRRREREEAGASPRLRVESGAYGVAWRLSVEMVAGLVFGGVLGWLLDSWLGTKPWLLIACFLLGCAAGMNSAIRAARRINAEAARADETD